MSEPVRIGVLALQGAVAEHLTTLATLGIDGVPVKKAEQLEKLDGLILPGGESTTIGKLLNIFDLRQPILDAVERGMGMFGTCAGAILLGNEALHADGEVADQPLFNLMDITVRRNAFGRQVDSFEAPVNVTGIDDGPFDAVFIRAPAIERVGTDVDVLARVEDRVVVCRQGRLLASSFHPELTNDARMHKFFVEIVR